jgi:hypothetical protein
VLDYFRALEPMTILGGPMKGMQDWMMEVQFRRSSTLRPPSLNLLTLTLPAVC